MTPITLKPGREKSVKNRHPWIFSGAIDNAPTDLKGEIHPVLSSSGEKLGSAYFNTRSQITGRFVAFGEEEGEAAVRKNILAAISKRKFDSSTTAYRLVNGEGDFLPGLTIDRYDDLNVIQISTLGMEKLKPLILELLDGPVYEKSNIASRKEEGMGPFEGWLRGEGKAERVVLENGIQYKVDIAGGQKTGFFLDQRPNRERIRALAKGKRVLNCFSYSGGFTLAALAGGALSVDSVDLSESACALVRENIALNGFSPQNVWAEDVFEFLRSKALDYDLVILDPPAFAKKQRDIIPACRGYKDINRLAMSKMPAGSTLLTCSCSHYVDEILFQKVIFQASIEAAKTAQIVGRHLLAEDHPVNICHPEGGYLKSLLLHL